jgi:hypothetical protein
MGSFTADRCNFWLKFTFFDSNLVMKTLRSILLLATLVFALSSCSVWNKVFKPKEGCGTNGKNVGAEKILSGESPKKSPKFKA